jgi:hypothetical protein
MLLLIIQIRDQLAGSRHDKTMEDLKCMITRQQAPSIVAVVRDPLDCVQGAGGARQQCNLALGCKAEIYLSLVYFHLHSPGKGGYLYLSCKSITISSPTLN